MGQGPAECRERGAQKLGLGHSPVIGLAKEFEEIYQPGRNRLSDSRTKAAPSNSCNACVMNRTRLANTYNAELRLRRISESILDEFPNIGERRKAALLKKFGSIQRMRIAPWKRLRRSQGFGGKAAAELKAFLDARSQTPMPG
jgi:excinuclease ABC subunit C